MPIDEPKKKSNTNFLVVWTLTEKRKQNIDSDFAASIVLNDRVLEPKNYIYECVVFRLTSSRDVY